MIRKAFLIVCLAVVSVRGSDWPTHSGTNQRDAWQRDETRLRKETLPQLKLLWKVTTENYVHGTPSVADGIAYISGCDEVFRGIRVSDGKELFQFPSGAYTGASPALVDGFAYYGTFSNEVVAANLKLKKVVWSEGVPSPPAHALRRSPSAWARASTTSGASGNW